MKFLNLVYEGFQGKSGTVDFTAKALGLIIVTEPEDFIKKLVSFALYGGDEGVDGQASFRLTFNHENLDYVITREVLPATDELVFTAEITDSDNKLIASGNEDCLAFIKEALNLDKNLFEELFFIDKLDVATAFSQDSLKRESYVEAKLQRLDGAENVELRYKTLLAEQAKYLAILEDTDPVTKAKLNDDKKAANSLKESLEDTRRQINDLYDDLSKVKQYNIDTTKFFEESAKLEKLNQRKPEIDANYNLAKANRSFKDIVPVFIKYKEIENMLSNDRLNLDKLIEKRKHLEEKHAASINSTESYKKLFVNEDDKKAIYQEKLLEFIPQIAKNPRSYKIYDRIDSFYAESIAKVEQLKQRNLEIEAEIEANSQSLRLLETQKKEIRLKASYKKDIADAAVLESTLNTLLSDIKFSEERIKELETERDRLSAEENRLNRLNSEMTKVRDSLLKQIKGRHKSIKDAVNEDAFYKQTIYARHLIVSANEVELNAIEQKINSVKEKNAQYRAKLEEAEHNKQKVEEHLNVINDRFTLLTDKKNEYASYNMMRDISDNIVLGSHCPVCDGFVTVKKEISEKNTKDLDAQIKAVNQEITRCNQALSEVNKAIGQFLAAESTSQKYLESLQQTLADKKAIINGILSEYSADSIPTLFKMVADAAEESNTLTLNIDKYNEIDAALTKNLESAKIIGERLNTINSNTLPREKQRFAENMRMFEEKTLRYETLQKALVGENGDSLLLKIAVAEKEYQTLEDEIDGKTQTLTALRDEYDDNLKLIGSLEARALPIHEGREDYTYQEIIVRTVAKDLSNLVDDINDTQKEKEVAKLRLSALLKVTAKLKDEIAEVNSEIQSLNQKIDSLETIYSSLHDEYGARFEEIGLTDIESVDGLILGDEQIVSYEKAYEENSEAIIRTSQSIAFLTASLEANQPYKDVNADMLALMTELKEKEARFILSLDEANKTLQTDQTNYNIIVSAKLRLTFIEAKIKGIDDLSQALTGTTIDRKGFADYTVNQANLKVKNWSAGNYYLEVRKDGIVLINAGKGKTLQTSSLTQSERALLDYAIALACNESLQKLMATDLPPIFTIEGQELNKNNISMLAEAAKEKDIIVVTPDDGAVFKTISKM